MLLCGLRLYVEELDLIELLLIPLERRVEFPELLLIVELLLLGLVELLLIPVLRLLIVELLRLTLLTVLLVEVVLLLFKLLVVEDLLL